jgi:glutathione S-transferase
VRVLYHFEHSPFSRRARLALHHKGLDAELRETRANESYLVEARKLTPIRTMPVLVDGDHVIADSAAIVQYLDLAYPDRPRLWPTSADGAAAALAITIECDAVLEVLVDMGTRYFALRNDSAWPAVLRERMERARIASEALAAKATRPFLVGDAWGAADLWVLSMVRWIAGFPARAATSPNIAQIITLGFQIPEPLVAWANRHANRPDVTSVYA